MCVGAVLVVKDPMLLNMRREGPFLWAGGGCMGGKLLELHGGVSTGGGFEENLNVEEERPGSAALPLHIF